MLSSLNLIIIMIIRRSYISHFLICENNSTPQCHFNPSIIMIPLHFIPPPSISSFLFDRYLYFSVASNVLGERIFNTHFTSSYMEASEPKWVTSDDIIYGVNSLRLGGLHINIRILMYLTHFYGIHSFYVFCSIFLLLAMGVFNTFFCNFVSFHLQVRI